ncbi:MAG: zinc ABC transporter ATP-binding protein ZnuC [Natronospirillum sp.]|uniref:zinc ABC transporter ATP-binding protein ZnuC n=1 Tax=Natronospirillum sp. TaxID=2812955 RepID=UPI0025CB9182|nr:zinc ABC transporter ATP-binding protein ZnuC [Natronospirillum sp.]MCH8551630.1 zinc ABC transporter ATP-binding protein ZnuC [Natronospirillum sp.]
MSLQNSLHHPTMNADPRPEQPPTDPSAEDGAAPLARLAEVTLNKGQRAVLDRISLQIMPRQIVTIVGPNGAGKSTLLRALLGLESPDSGQVWRQPGLTIGYMPQRLPLNQLFPVSVGRFMRLQGKPARAAVEDALAMTGVVHLTDRPLAGLSGGELQRVLLARAIVQKPDLLVLDEPVQGVDFMGEAALYRLIHSLKETLDCSVLMVSHDLHVVMAATDQVICLNHHVCCQGAPETVESHPEFVQIFGQRDAATLGVYHHHHTHHHDLSEQGGPAVRD